MDESWVVKANRERDLQHQIESRAKFEEFREDIKARLKGPHAPSEYEFPAFEAESQARDAMYEEVGH
jgi:hypothetical protein